MAPISYVRGDATNPLGRGEKIICHCCNDRGGRGKGFVLSLSKKWEAPEIADSLIRAAVQVTVYDIG